MPGFGSRWNLIVLGLEAIVPLQESGKEKAGPDRALEGRQEREGQASLTCGHVSGQALSPLPSPSLARESQGSLSVTAHVLTTAAPLCSTSRPPSPGRDSPLRLSLLKRKRHDRLVPLGTKYISIFPAKDKVSRG